MNPHAFALAPKASVSAISPPGLILVSLEGIEPPPRLREQILSLPRLPVSPQRPYSVPLDPRPQGQFEFEQ